MPPFTASSVIDVENAPLPIATGVLRRCGTSPVVGLTETCSCTEPVKPLVGVSFTVLLPLAPGLIGPGLDTPIVKFGGGPSGGGGGGVTTPAAEKAVAEFGVPRPV